MSALPPKADIPARQTLFRHARRRPRHNARPWPSIHRNTHTSRQCPRLRRDPNRLVSTRERNVDIRHASSKTPRSNSATLKLNLKLRNDADWRQPFMLPTTDLTRAALRMRLGTIDLSTSKGRIVIDDPTMGAFSFVVPAADLSTVQPGHYCVELLVFHPA